MVSKKKGLWLLWIYIIIYIIFILSILKLKYTSLEQQYPLAQLLRKITFMQEGGPISLPLSGW